MTPIRRPFKVRCHEGESPTLERPCGTFSSFRCHPRFGQRRRRCFEARCDPQARPCMHPERDHHRLRERDIVRSLLLIRVFGEVIPVPALCDAICHDTRVVSPLHESSTGQRATITHACSHGRQVPLEDIGRASPRLPRLTSNCLPSVAIISPLSQVSYSARPRVANQVAWTHVDKGNGICSI